MIARTWRGETAVTDGDAYVAYLERTGLAAYRATPGNRGAHLLRRELGTTTEFVTLTFWDDVDAVRRFAGDDITLAVFYPEDDRFLVERDLRATHFEVDTRQPDQSG
jgi:heme-degrading monooxygenase HmoA